LTLTKARFHALTMTKPQLNRVVRRFDRAGRAGMTPTNAFILAVIQERAAIYANHPPRDLPRDWPGAAFSSSDD
jgi:hypothetical protein